MPRASEYNTRMIWMKADSDPSIDYGNKKPTYTDNGEVWASVQDLTGNETVAFNVQQNIVTTLIRIRDHWNISNADQLHDKYSGEVYELDAVQYGDRELIIPARRIRRHQP